MSEEVKTDVDPEPEGIIEIDKPQGAKERVVPLATLTAERERIRKVEAERHAKELEPLKAKAAQADQLAADLESIKPFVEKLKAKPELMKEDEPPEQQKISDAEAEQFARQFELYAGSGLDLKRARAIIVNQRAEIEKVARAAAQEAVRPVAERTAYEQSRANFLAAVQARDSSGRALVDPNILAEHWRMVPADLSAQAEVANLILDRAIGAQYRSGKQPPATVTHEPIFSEAAGGGGRQYAMSDEEKKMQKITGMDEKKWTATASKYVPGAVNVIGE